MKYLNFFCLACLCLMFYQNSTAQISLGAHIVAANGVNAFGENIEAAAGISVAAMYSIPNSPLSFGVDLGSFCYDMNESNRSLAQEGYEEVYADVSEESGFATYAITTRIDLNKPSMINPYLEGRLALYSFYNTKEYSNFSKLNEDAEVPEDLHCEIDYLGTSFHSGLGGGIMWDMEKMFDSSSHWFIDMGVTFFQGNETTYMPSKDEIQAQLKNSTVHTRTDNIAYRLGVFFKLD